MFALVKDKKLRFRIIKESELERSRGEKCTIRTKAGETEEGVLLALTRKRFVIFQILF